MMTKKEKEKFEKKLSKFVTPYDKDLKNVIMEIQDIKQMMIHMKYNITHFEKRIEYLNNYKKKLEKKIKKHQDEKSL